MKNMKTKLVALLSGQVILGVILVLGVLLTGCGTTQSRMAVWEKNTEKLSIQAIGKTGNFSTEIILYVNGEEVAKGSTTSIRSTANLSGMYKTHKIDADCKSVAVGSILHRECTVYVDGEKFTELSF
jgi:hypothetical protein